MKKSVIPVNLPGQLSRTGWMLPTNMEVGQWLDCGAALNQIEGAVQWWIGDWWRFGKDRKDYGTGQETAEQIGFEYQTCMNVAWVAAQVPFSRRRENLSFKHHAEIAGRPEHEQDQWLDRAEREHWSAEELRAKIRAASYSALTSDGCTVADLNQLITADKKYAVIYADPPWSFQVYSGKGKMRSAERHYDTQSLNEIKALPVADLAADDCALLLWAVMPQLPEALEVIAAWGFTYKTTGFVWIKENRSGDGLFTGMGYWTRANAEVCLLATKGSPARQAKDVHQVVRSPVSEHSRKPDEVQVRIERLLPGPYLELFGRRAVPHWTVWGNEIERSIFHQHIPEFAYHVPAN